MIGRVVLLTWLIQLSLGSLTICLSQDSTKVLVLSPRVGPKISAVEREYFHLFPQFEHFVDATAFQTADGRCFVRITVEPSHGVFRDSVVQYGRRTLQIMAEKIDHFEELEAGTYQIGDQSARLQTMNGERVIEKRVPETDSSATEWRALDQARRWQRNGPSRDNITVGLSTGLSLRGNILEGVRDSSFSFESGREVHSLPVKSVDLLLRHRESQFWAGAGIGTLLGIVVGGVIGYATYTKPERKPGQWIVFDFGPGVNALAGAIVGLPVGFAIGGAVGASREGDDVINMTGTDYHVKLTIIRMVISSKGN